MAAKGFEPRTVLICSECSTPFRRWPSATVTLFPTCGMECRDNRRRRIGRLNSTRNDGLRTCSACEVDKPATPEYFAPFRDPRRARILANKCRECTAKAPHARGGYVAEPEVAPRVPRRTPRVVETPVPLPTAEELEEMPLGAYRRSA